MKAMGKLLVTLPHAYNPDGGTRVQPAWQRHSWNTPSYRRARGSFPRAAAPSRQAAPAASP
ncbi:hypothetical protein Slala03_67630 [Streptomyces lavendulae subsp. lavendulae]|nr:hypothetical protein Slala03_67630 [Streptomyces lavendulae subsp. lavendulae]GLV98500.1 hypothetical protein Slala05_21320 [Streptomyces lavendulae subsp. lavendulae]GLX35030.1 hypothetical protein Sros01_11030 [Streptomyces roseochromogenus]